MVIVKNLYLDYIFFHPECLCILRFSYFHHPGDDDDELSYSEKMMMTTRDTY
jgi:hypothetical protein